MELSRSESSIPKLFIILGLMLLVIGLVFGIAGGIQYIVPGWMKAYLSFEKVRPLHVSSMVFWIIAGVCGGAMTYMAQHSKRPFSESGLRIQFLLFLSAVVFILGSYISGHFGGREYWEFPPVLALLIIASWLVFLINFLRTMRGFRNQPVYVWMWLTGLCFFLFTFLESYLWLLPYFNTHIVNDMTIQWKSYGSMVGSWNMLMYGSSIFLMDKISGNKDSSHSPLAFWLYFIGLFNLMFNWGHHIYTLPTHNYVKHISYAVSMTELILLARIIFNWKRSLTDAKKYLHKTPFLFLVSAELWIFINLTLAIAMSIPGINVYTHGTHVTVAHTMGATIGINTFILLAVACDILTGRCARPALEPNRFKRLLIFTHISLMIFWLALIAVGVLKAHWQMSAEQIPFSSFMVKLRPYFMMFLIAGTALAIGLSGMVLKILQHYWLCRRQSMHPTSVRAKEAI